MIRRKIRGETFGLSHTVLLHPTAELLERETPGEGDLERIRVQAAEPVFPVPLAA